MANRTKQKDINAAQRSQLALKLRSQGLELSAIAKMCGYKDASGAHYAIKRALDALPVEDALTLRRVEMAHLEQLRATIMPYIESTEQDTKPNDDDGTKLVEKKPKKTKINLFAVDRLVAISKRYSEVTGMDARPDSEQENKNYTKRIILTHITEVQQ